MMRFVIFLFVLVASSDAMAQFREIYVNELWYLQQPDSLYKANKVKTRTTYRLSDLDQTQKVPKLKLTFDTEGRIVEMEFEPRLSGRIQTSHFSYNTNGNIGNAHITLRKGNPNAAIKDWATDDADIRKALKKYPGKELFTVHQSNLGDSLTRYSVLDEAGKLKATMDMTLSGTYRYKQFAENEKDNYSMLIRYLPNRNFKYLPIYHAFWIGPRPSNEATHYRYEFGNGVIAKLILQELYRGELMNEKVYRLEYSSAGLLTKAKIDYGTHVYEYTFYE